MPRTLVMLLLVGVLLAGALFLLSRQATEEPTRTVETEIDAVAND